MGGLVGACIGGGVEHQVGAAAPGELQSHIQSGHQILLQPLQKLRVVIEVRDGHAVFRQKAVQLAADLL